MKTIHRVRSGIRRWTPAAFAALLLMAVPAGSAPAPAGSPPQVVVTAPVTSEKLQRTIQLPGELRAMQDVAVYSKVQGFVAEIPVDRGSLVKKGQLLARLTAPELPAQQKQAEAAAQSAVSQRIEAEAKLRADEGTHRRMKAANDALPGMITDNDLDIASQNVAGDRAKVEALGLAAKAAREYAHALQATEAYLTLGAPFTGVVTERNVHLGSFVGPQSAGASVVPAMLRLQQIDPMRLVVAVPERELGEAVIGTKIGFTVPAHPGRTFVGVLQRTAHALDPVTRTMAIELDVPNGEGLIAPGMYAEVAWPVSKRALSLFVPPAAVVSTTERTFVIRVRDGVAEWVDVRKGTSLPNRLEVFGDLKAGDAVAARGTDELRAGTRVMSKPLSTPH